MSNKNQLTFAHALVVLPDKRMLLRKPCYKTNYQSDPKWSATIEKQVPIDEAPYTVITGTILATLGLHFFTKATVSDAIIYPLEYIMLKEYNRIIFPFIVEINKALTLKTDKYSQFSAQPFSVLMVDIMKNTIYAGNVFGTKHTLNTVHVMKEVHLNNVFDHIPTKEAL